MIKMSTTWDRDNHCGMSPTSLVHDSSRLTAVLDFGMCPIRRLLDQLMWPVYSEKDPSQQDPASSVEGHEKLAITCLLPPLSLSSYRGHSDPSSATDPRCVDQRYFIYIQNGECECAVLSYNWLGVRLFLFGTYGNSSII